MIKHKKHIFVDFEKKLKKETHLSHIAMFINAQVKCLF